MLLLYVWGMYVCSMYVCLYCIVCFSVLSLKLYLLYCNYYIFNSLVYYSKRVNFYPLVTFVPAPHFDLNFEPLLALV